MKPEIEKSSGRATARKGLRNINRADLAVPLLIFAGFGAAFVSGVPIVAIAYDPQRREAMHVLSVDGPALLFLPCFLMALLRRRWASIPLWVCCLSLIVESLVVARHPAEGIGTIQPGIGIFFVPTLVQIARFFRGDRP
jgi:hypothetical protein